MCAWCERTKEKKKKRKKARACRDIVVCTVAYIPKPRFRYRLPWWLHLMTIQWKCSNRRESKRQTIAFPSTNKQKQTTTTTTTTTGLITINRRHINNTGHNNRDLDRLRWLSAGMRVEARYINSTRSHILLPFIVLWCWSVWENPQWGAADAEIKVPSDENTELKRSPFQAWSRSVYSHTFYAYCQGYLPCLFLHFRSIHLHFFQNFCRNCSCVGCG